MPECTKTLEEGDLFIKCYVKQLLSGKWSAWATFEQLTAPLSSLAERETRCNISAHFDSRELAAQACTHMALIMAREHHVVFE